MGGEGGGRAADGAYARAMPHGATIPTPTLHAVGARVSGNATGYASEPLCVSRSEHRVDGLVDDLCHERSPVEEEVVEAGLGEDDLNVERDIITAVHFGAAAAEGRELTKRDADAMRCCKREGTSQLLEKIRPDRVATRVPRVVCRLQGSGLADGGHCTCTARPTPLVVAQLRPQFDKMDFVPRKRSCSFRYAVTAFTSATSIQNRLLQLH